MLQSAGALLIQALPTFFIVIFLHWYLKFTLFKPLEKVLAERHAETQGAREKATAALAAAERKVNEYEDKLKAARTQIFQEQETWRKSLIEDQNDAIAAARESNLKLIGEAKSKIAEEVQAAHATLNKEVEALADQIVARVLAGSKN